MFRRVFLGVLSAASGGAGGATREQRRLSTIQHGPGPGVIGPEYDYRMNVHYPRSILEEVGASLYVHGETIGRAIPDHRHFLGSERDTAVPTEDHTHTYIRPGRWIDMGPDEELISDGVWHDAPPTAGSNRPRNRYPMDVDVVVNGTSQGTSLGTGTGEFESTVDLDGVLSSGWNTIRLTSAKRGQLQATFSADLLRRVP